jgi:hypothetical protein
MARRESSNIERAHLAARNAELEAETRSLRRRYQEAVREKERLERRVGALEQTVSTLRAALAKAQAALRTLRHLHFGRSSERGAVPGTESEAEQPAPAVVRKSLRRRVVTLSRNLSRPDYVTPVCGTPDELPARFSAIDAAADPAALPDPAPELTRAALPLGDRRLVRRPAFRQRLVAACSRRQPQPN